MKRPLHVLIGLIQTFQKKKNRCANIVLIYCAKIVFQDHCSGQKASMRADYALNGAKAKVQSGDGDDVPLLVLVAPCLGS